MTVANISVLVEIELTFLAKEFPPGIVNTKPLIMVDTYVPETVDHACLRIRKQNDKYEITKKQPVSGVDSSYQTEETIPLDAKEYETLASSSRKRVEKYRYKINIDGHPAEVDVFMGDLKGLVLIDFEFDTLESKASFVPPACCLVDVTQDRFVAGGVLAGKKYSDIASELSKRNYIPLSL